MNTGAIRARDLAVLQNQRTRRPAGPLGLDLRYAVLLSCQRFETRGSDCLPLESMRASTGGRCCSQPLNARRFHQKTGLKQQSDGGIGAKWWPGGPTPYRPISQLRESPRVASCCSVIRRASRMPRRASASPNDHRSKRGLHRPLPRAGTTLRSANRLPWTRQHWRLGTQVRTGVRPSAGSLPFSSLSSGQVGI